MKLLDYHTHNKLCNHASGNLESYIKMAIKRNLAEIGLSDHFPWNILPSDPPIIKHQWLLSKFSMPLKKFSKYIKTAKFLREKYKDKIQVKISAEIDYIHGTAEMYKIALTPFVDDFDYLIGSVHTVQWNGVERWIINGRKALAKYKEHGDEKICIEYFDALTRMVQTGLFDIVGHLDNQKIPHKPEYNEKSWQKLLKLLEAIKTSGMAVEINTSGFWKGAGEQFPSDDIIKELIQRQIPITLGSDAHKPTQVAFKFEEIIAKLQEMGLTHLCTYSKRIKSSIKIEA